MALVRQSRLGAGLAGARFVAELSDRAWRAPSDAGNTSPEREGAGGAGDAVRAAADWLVEQLRAGDSDSLRLDALVVDPGAGACGWAALPTTEARAVEAFVHAAGPVSGGGGGGGSDGTSEQRATAALAAFAPGAMDSSVTALAPPPGAGAAAGAGGAVGAERTALLAAPDAPARVLLDELDRRGVQVRRVLTPWHALALGAQGAAPDAGLDAGAESPLVASVLVEAPGRVLWAWSRGGRLVACGSARVAARRAEDGQDPESVLPALSEHDAARLAADWLGWAAQVGDAPARVVCVTPEADEEGARALGAALVRLWPGAPVQMVPVDDPGLALLSRLRVTLAGAPAGAAAAATQDGSRGWTRLSSRPGRAVRSLHLWAGAALLAGAAFAALAAYWMKREGDHARAAARLRDEAWRADARRVTPSAEIIPPSQIVQTLEQEASAARARLRLPERAAPARPVLEELEAISLVLGMEGVHATRLTVSSEGLIVRLLVADARTGEEIHEALQAVGGSSVAAWDFRTEPARSPLPGLNIEVQLDGRWGAPGGGAGGSGSGGARSASAGGGA